MKRKAFFVPRNNTVPNADRRKIAEIRKAKTPRRSQERVAKRLRLEGAAVDKGAVQRIEAGKRSLTRQELNALAAVLQVVPEALLAEERGGTACCRNGRICRKSVPPRTGDAPAGKSNAAPCICRARLFC